MTCDLSITTENRSVDNPPKVTVQFIKSAVIRSLQLGKHINQAKAYCLPGTLFCLPGTLLPLPGTLLTPSPPPAHLRIPQSNPTRHSARLALSDLKRGKVS